MQALTISGLRKVYKNNIEALTGIDLVVAEGDFFALLGPNGAGKSTIIGILCSLIHKTTGHVAIFGHNLDQDPEAAKRCIGLVPQEYNFNQFQLVGEIIVNQAGYYGIPRHQAWIWAKQFLT
ncbi:ABC transporter, partial [Achromatium sp. WMS1]